MKILMQFDVDPRQFLEEINKALLRPRNPDDTIDLLVDTRIDVGDA